jgi:antitoxin (DNA-binding transcriptional repressor) of toxin-antitoxin stability system
MSTSISIGKAKPGLCDLVEQAGKGKTHIITVHDEPVAQLGPLPLRSMELTEQWRERRKKILLNPKGKKPLEIADLIREGRK